MSCLSKIQAGAGMHQDVCVTACIYNQGGKTAAVSIVSKIDHQQQSKNCVTVLDTSPIL